MATETKQARWAKAHPEERRKIHREGQRRRRKKKPAIADELDAGSVEVISLECTRESGTSVRQCCHTLGSVQSLPC